MGTPTTQKASRSRRSGRRHRLLIYERTMNRLWQPTLALGLLLGGLWAVSWFTQISILRPGGELWLFAGAAACLGFALFAWLTRSMAYVQPNLDHLRLVTPFLRLNISYRRVRSVHPGDFTQLFPPNKSSWAQRSFLEPLYGRTAVLVELNGYPLPLPFLRLFLASQMFSPQSTALVLLVPDWMAFSTELDSALGAWQPAAPRPSARPRR